MCMHYHTKLYFNSNTARIMIEVKNLHKSFDGIKVLNAISASFERGKTSLVIGESGSGKTVLLKCLLGLHNYDEGEIIFDGINYKSISDKQKIGLKSKIGTVFQGSALFDSMNIEENVMIPLRMFNNYNYDEMLDRVNDVLKRVFTILKNKNENKNDFEFSGYIEGNQIMDGNVDVIITDGFTGNIALKTAEGTANFITRNLKKSLNIFSLIFSYFSLKKFKEKLDPRKYNGAIFIGLQNPVVKSHGGTDAVGFAHSINVCNKIVKSN